ncbi:hypothetical protein ABZ370_33315 [Streptomyces sp. NPDC005962]|uniref:hypothetical protein n=1 Tax=Streptomyces sp. NPDC005962 TaxID=3154466 RepID=UPI0033DD4124
MNPLTKEELLSKYADDDTRDKIFRLNILSDFLGTCLIASNYKPPSQLTETIKLTPYGNDKVQAFAKRRIPIPEARTFCLLELSWIDLLIDPQATDMLRLQEAISRQIIERKINYPFIFGRELYDRAYEHPSIGEDTRTLDLSDTLDVLEGTPQGVFQMYDYVTGPYGLLSSKSHRFYPPQQYANLVHCSDVNCHQIHSVHFTTSRDASINKHREEGAKTLKKDSETPSAWASFITQIFSDKVNSSLDTLGDPLISILGDCLTLEELSSLTAWLLDNTRGQLRETCQTLRLTGNAAQIVAGMSRAHLMQLSLTTADRDINQGIDALVHSGQIMVPDTEVRRPLVNDNASFADFRLFAEVGSLGVRVRSAAMHLAPLRLRHLVERMYRLTDMDDREELEWQLRSAKGASLEARLEEYLQSKSPREVVETLVLVRKSNAVAACELLGLREGATEDENFISLILWKLGFASASISDPHARFWRLHEDMERTLRMGPGGPLGPTVDEFAEKVRNNAGSYFVELEETLCDSLAFTIWGLTHDHFMDRRPFVYRKGSHENTSFAWLHNAVRRSDDEQLRYDGDKKPALYALCRGFQCISAELKRLAGEREANTRPLTLIPDWASRQELQKFPFRHSVPFLDLTDESREMILKRLLEISRTLVSGDVHNVRNDWLHGGRDVPDPERFRASLSAIKSAVQLIEDSGFSRISFAISGHRSDGFGRSVTTLANHRGVKLDVHNPSPFDWLKLPSTGVAQHVMTAACFSAPGDFLRFSSEETSPYAEMWSDYPRRMAKSQRVGHALDGVSASGSWESAAGTMRQRSSAP